MNNLLVSASLNSIAASIANSNKFIMTIIGVLSFGTYNYFMTCRENDRHNEEMNKILETMRRENDLQQKLMTEKLMRCWF